MKNKLITVEALAVSNRKAGCCENRDALEVTLEGIVDDKHFGFVKPADARDNGVKRGTPVRNWRQWSAVSQEEMTQIALNMGLKELDSTLLSANITFSGVDAFSKLPAGTRIVFDSGAILEVEEENEPCTGPGKEIAKVHPDKEPHVFVKAAMNLRGVVGVVFKAGVIRVKDQAQLVMYRPPGQ